MCVYYSGNAKFHKPVLLPLSVLLFSFIRVVLNFVACAENVEKVFAMVLVSCIIILQ